MTADALVKVAIVDDHWIVRDGIARQLTTDKTIEVILQARHGQDLLDQLKSATVFPDVVIIDVRMPVMDGFTLADHLTKYYPQIKILVLSAYSSPYNVALMIKKGVCGYLLKDSNPSHLRKAVHSIHETGHYYSDLANENAFRTAKNKNLKSLDIPEREMEFFKLCCKNLEYEGIAQKMGISLSTVHGTRTRLFGRLGIGTRVELLLFAMQTGMVSPEDEDDYLRPKF